jgi:hypothetical protein
VPSVNNPSGAALSIQPSSLAGTGYLIAADNPSGTTKFYVDNQGNGYVGGTLAIGTSTVPAANAIEALNGNIVATSNQGIGAVMGLYHTVGDLPGFPAGAYPVLKTDYSDMYIVVGGNYAAYIDNLGGYTINAGGSFTGSGSGLSSLNATNLTTGTVADARLSSNVDLLNTAQSTSAAKTFGAQLNIASGIEQEFINASGNYYMQDSGGTMQWLQTNNSTVEMSLTQAGALTVNGGETITTGGLTVSAGGAGISGTVSITGSGSSSIVGNTGAALWGATNSSTAGGYGLEGIMNGAGNSGTAVYGVNFSSTGSNFGVKGSIATTGGGSAGVWGSSTGGGGTTYGGYFDNNSPSGYSIYGASVTGGPIFDVNSVGVGIGTITPLDKLHVEQGNIRLNAAAGTAGFLNFFKAGVEVGYLANGGADNNLWMQAMGATGGINFQTGGSNTRMTINSTGTVGIGLAATDQNSGFLHVKGEYPAGTGTSAMFGSVTPLSFVTGGAGNMNMGWNAYYDGTWRNYTASKYTAIQALDSNLGDMVFYTGNAPATANSAIGFAEHLRLTNAGHLGINQASPTRSILDVSGAVGNTIAIFGSGSSGISMVQAWPSIGFNSYFNGAWRALSAGAGANIGVNPSTGDMQFISNSNVAQDVVQATTVQMQINAAGGVTINNGGGNVPHACAYYYCFVGGVTQGVCNCPGGMYPISGGGDCLGNNVLATWPNPTFGSGSRADTIQSGWGMWCSATSMDVWVNCCSI